MLAIQTSSMALESSRLLVMLMEVKMFGDEGGHKDGHDGHYGHHEGQPQKSKHLQQLGNAQ